ncbi:DUF5723 family protein [Polaribacter sp.]|nr:DUF5723 family protein [Polaribacter sp.]
MLKQKLFYFFCVFSIVCFSQNKPILYDFANQPQSQLLNPAIDLDNKYHIGVPLLGGLHAEIGLKNFDIYDFFGANSISFYEKLLNLSDQLTPNDYFTINGQVDILNGGFRLGEKNYLSFGFYQETDAIAYYPEDAIDLYLAGNELNRVYNVSHMNFKADVLGVFHVGLSKKINEKIHLGTRLKLYTSILQAQSKNNTGTVLTAEGDNNLLIHYLNNIDINIETSGLLMQQEREEDEEASAYTLAEALSKNLGLGIDFGFVNQISPQLKLTASILDFGFISHSNRVQNYTVKGEYTFEGVEANFTGSAATRSWADLERDLDERLPYRKNTESYISLRPLKINASMKYSFGKYRSKLCYDNTYKKKFTSAVGAQLFSVIRPLGPQLALTGFFETDVTRNFTAKLTYTADSYSLSNIGIGASTKIGKVNFYGTIGNLAQFIDLSRSKTFSAQMGISFISN